MKKLLFILLVVIILPAVVQAQLPSDALFQKYANKEGAEVSAISGFMLKPFVENLISSLAEADKEKARQYMNNISSIAIVQSSGKDNKLKKEIMDEANKISKNSKYSELISMKKDNQNFKVVNLNNNGKITEILGFGSDSNEMMLVSIQGTFTEAMIKDVLATASKYFR